MNTFFFVTLQPNAGQGLLIHQVSRSHTATHHTRQDSSGRVISSSQRPLPDNTKHQQQKTSMPPARFEPAIPAGERPQIYALDCTTTGIGSRHTHTHTHAHKNSLLPNHYPFFIRYHVISFQFVSTYMAVKASLNSTLPNQYSPKRHFLSRPYLL